MTHDFTFQCNLTTAPVCCNITWAITVTKQQANRLRHQAKLFAGTFTSSLRTTMSGSIAPEHEAVYLPSSRAHVWKTCEVCLHTKIHMLIRTSSSYYLHFSSILFEPLRPVTAEGSQRTFHLSLSRAIALAPFHDLHVIN